MMQNLLELTCDVGGLEYGVDDTLLYNLATGFGRSDDPRELDYLLEPQLRPSPTFASTLGLNQACIMNSGLDLDRIVHFQLHILLHRAIPAEARYAVRDRVVGVVDKGPARGALVATEKRILLEGSSEPLCTLRSVLFARADGGIGDCGAPPALLDAPPDRPPDMVVESEVRPEQAHLYALTGDRALLHRDPTVAKEAGFPSPIVHGACTLGIACQALVAVCEFDADRITELQARFTAPTYPGDTLRTEVWRGDGILSFRTAVRDRVVIDNGFCRLR